MALAVPTVDLASMTVFSAQEAVNISVWVNEDNPGWLGVVSPL